MKVYNTVFGIFAVLGALFCIIWPGMTFVDAKYIAIIFTGAWGLCALLNYLTSKEKDNKTIFKSFIFGILAVLFATFIGFSMFMPAVKNIFGASVIYIFAVWAILGAIGDVILAVDNRKDNNRWMLSLILSILVLAGCIYGVLHAIFAPKLISIIFGIVLLVYGIRNMASAFENE